MASPDPALAERLGEWQTLLSAPPVLGRQILRKLLVGRLGLTPQADAEGGTYAWTGQASYGRCLAGMLGVLACSPRGRRCCPRIGSADCSPMAALGRIHGRAEEAHVCPDQSPTTPPLTPSAGAPS